MLSTFFEIRKRIPRLRGKAYRESSTEAQARALGLPGSWGKQLSQKALELNALYSYILEQIPPFELEPAAFREAYDLGSKDFSYAPSLSTWLTHRFSDSQWTLKGLEVDPYQIYFDFYRRLDVASYYASVASRENLSVQYEAADWLRFPVQESPAILFCLFPYLFEDLHRGAGLPPRHFDPFQFYQKMASARPQAILFFHQGAQEKQASLELIQKTLKRGEVIYEERITENPYLMRKHPIEVLLWKT